MPTRRSGARLLLVGAAYYVGAQLGLQLALYNSQVTPFWPPTGIAMAAMLLWCREMWPAVAVSAFLVNISPSDGTWTAALISVGNTAAPLLAVTALRRVRFNTELAKLRDAGALVAIGALAMTVSAGMGTCALLLDGLPTRRAVSVVVTWWTGDTVGALIVTPFLLALAQQLRSPRPTRQRALEALGLLSLVVLSVEFGFRSTTGLRFLVFPVLAVAALRFQLRGAAPATLLASLLATEAASEGAGTFAALSTTHAMVALSLFNGCITFTSYVLSALTTDRARAQREQALWGDQLERLVDARTEQLSHALDQLTKTQELAGLGTCSIDLMTGRATWSEELYRLMQLPVGSPMTVDIFMSLVHPDEVDEVTSALMHTVASGEPFAMDHRLRKGDGTYRWLHCQGEAVRDDHGVVVGTRGTAADIDDRKRAERRFAQLVEMAPDAMVFVDAGGVITQINRQTEVLFGYDRGELVGQHLEVLIPARFHTAHRQHREAFAAHPTVRPMGRDRTLMAVRRDGSEFPVEISLSPLETEDGQLVSAAIRDVTERQHQQDELSYRSLHDTLTGLPNRALLADRVQHALSSLGRGGTTMTTVVFVDLDRFKWVNDSLGHDAGDALLRVVAERLASVIRPGDTVARFGGDEFVVLGTTLHDAHEAHAFADRLRLAVAVPVDLPGGQTVVPTVSVGITTTTDPATDPAELLRDADAAMYRAKEAGRDRTAFYEPGIQEVLEERLTTAGGLRNAIEQGELRVHYQPVLDLSSGEVVAVEALVRWEHPVRGLLYPGEFIELAEETGQVEALDRAVIVQACREFGALAAANTWTRPVSLNINVSLRHLSTARLREALVEGLAAGSLPPDLLTVEVTESADLSGESFAALLDMVRGIGARVAVDDFGTGFSALSRLGGLGVDVIKVDRSFVREVHTSPRARAIVSAMVRLASALEASVVAEGVEVQQQVTALRDLGCLAGQGFYWSPGLPVDQLGPWLSARSVPPTLVL
jgi:diguanylate cyclase (GGDEF)-like protein/PAS domain S-box-containing protein